MGLFSSKKKTNYYTQTQLIADPETKDVITQTVLTTVLQNQNYSTAIQDNLINCGSANARTLHNYAKRGETTGGAEGYVYGLTTGHTLALQGANVGMVKLCLEQEAKGNVKIDMYLLDRPSSEFLSHGHLTNTRGWDSKTDLIANPPEPVGRPVYLDKVGFKSSTSIEIVYRYDLMGKPKYLTEVIPCPDTDMDDVYYYVTYYMVDALGAVVPDLRYWIHPASSPKYPTLNLPEYPEKYSEYLPVIPIRDNGRDITDPNQAGYSERVVQSCRTALGYLGVKLKDISNGVHGRSGDEWEAQKPTNPHWVNPECAEVDFAYVMLGIDIGSKYQASKEYLFRFFSDEYYRAVFGNKDYAYWETYDRGNAYAPLNQIIIRDLSDFQIEVAWHYIDRVEKKGIPAGDIKVGEYGSRYSEWFENQSEDIFERRRAGGSLVCTYRVSADTYIEMAIYGLTHLNHVYLGNPIQTNVKDAFEGNDGFYLPMNMKILQDMGAIHGTQLINQSLRMVMNTKIVTKIKWYQSGIFKALVQIVAIVVSVWSMGTLGPAMSSIAAVIGVVTTKVLIAVAMNMLIGVAIKVVTDVIGGELGMIVANIAALFAGNGFQMPNIWQAMATTLKSVGQIVQVQTLDKLVAIKDELEDINKEMEELTDKLDTDVTDALAVVTSNQIDYSAYKLSPSQFIDKAIHNPIPGLQVLEVVPNWVDAKLKPDLPWSPIRNRVW